jgi:D-3-phosphoglycerate dehydrogenase / 2-oxoglutarate reductase
LLNYPDVLAALNSGMLLGVGVDVYHTEPFPSPLTDPFLSHPRVVATPHVAGVTHRSYANMAALVAENVLLVKAGQTPNGAVNTPGIVTSC